MAHSRRTVQLSRLPLAGFTLVELLVVITIIGILVALLLPAIQAAREAARQAQCLVNLKNIAQACLTHEEKQGHLPSNGWGSSWIGDPDRGYGRKQPGGWTYNVLPYLDEQSLHDLGQAMDATDKSMEAVKLVQTALPVLYCPTRRGVVLIPNTDSSHAGYKIYNCNGGNPVTPRATSDYACNLGSQWYYWDSDTTNHYTINPRDSTPRGGADCFAAPSGPTLVAADVRQASWGDRSPYYCWDGTIFPMSRVKISEIQDGTSVTYLLGEKYMNPEHYFDGVCAEDFEACYTGSGSHSGRLCQRYQWDDPNLPPDPLNSDGCMHPRQDKGGRFGNNLGYTNNYIFGSAHTNGFNMAFCDGSVKLVSYMVAMEIHQCLGARNDHLPLDAKKLP